MSAARTDVHSPARFDPADYQVIDYLDNKRPDPPYPGAGPDAYEHYREYVALWQARIFEHFPDWRTGGDDHKSVHQCNHCGHPGIRWVAVVEHTPSGKRLAFGEICADRCELPGRDAFRSKFVKTRAEKEKAAFEKAMAASAFRDSAPDVVEFLEGLNADYDSREPEFLLSLKAQLSNKGELSERQVEAARKFLVKRQEREARFEVEREAMKDAPPLVEGRRVVEGEILSTKVQDGYYGSQLKMLVREDDGNKVWGTVPRSLEDLTFSRYDYNGAVGEPNVVEGVELRGSRVRFTAKVERSRDDEHFGFFKRPTGAELVEDDDDLHEYAERNLGMECVE